MRSRPSALLLVLFMCAACERSPSVVTQEWIAVVHSDDATLHGLAVDAAGNSYLAGSFSGELRPGGALIEAPDGMRGFVAQLRPDGSWGWIVPALAGDVADAASAARAVAVDASGNVHVVGDYRGSLKLGDQRVLSTGGSDLFVARLGPDGVVDWLVSSSTPGANSAAFGHGVAVDDLGRVYISGLFTGEMALGSATVTCADVDYFVASLETGGEVRWAEAGGASEWALARSIALAPDDALVVAGEVSGMLSDGTVAVGETDAFVAKHRRRGGLVWSTAAGGPNEDRGRALAVTPEGELWLTGGYSKEARFGSAKLTSSASGFNGYVARLDARGDVLAVDHARGRWQGEGLDVTTVGAEALVAGRFSGDIQTGGALLSSAARSQDGLLVRVDDGGLVTGMAVGGSLEDHAAQVEVAPDGSLRLAGRLSGAVKVAGYTVAAGRRGIFIWKLAPGLF